MRKNKAIVLSDLHELLSKAKNPTAWNIRICDPKFILLILYKNRLRLNNANLKNCVFHFAVHSACTIFALNKDNFRKRV